MACQVAPEAPASAPEPKAEPTISNIFSLGGEDAEGGTNFGDSSDFAIPPLPTVRPLATSSAQTVSVPAVTESDLIVETIYDDALNANWIAGNVSGMQYDLESETAVFNGTNAIALSPTADFGAFVLAVGEESDTIYYRDQVMGFKFQLYTGEKTFDPGSLAVSINGSNDYIYHVPEDDSVLGVGTGPIFPETRLYFLDYERDLPPDTWVDLEIWLDDLLYDPEYDFVTALYIRNDEGFYDSFAIDKVEIIRLPSSDDQVAQASGGNNPNASITLQDVFVRQGPSISDSLITRLSANIPLTIIEFEGDWANISFMSNNGETTTGWVPRFEIQGGDPPTVSTAPTEPSATTVNTVVEPVTPTIDTDEAMEVSDNQPTPTATTTLAQPTATATSIAFGQPTVTPVVIPTNAVTEDGLVLVPLIPTPIVTDVFLPTVPPSSSGLPPTATPSGFVSPTETPLPIPATAEVIEIVTVVDATETPFPLPVCRTVDQLASVLPTNVVTQGPWSTWPGEGKIINYVETDLPLLGLTFDAEGDASSVRALLDVLDSRQVKATFFIEGQWAQDNSSLVTEMANRGHEFGNHAFSGDDIIEFTGEELAIELANTEAIVQALTDGQTTKPYYRPPFGHTSETSIQLAGELGYFTALWTAGSGDWIPETDTEEMCGILMRDSFQGAIMSNHTFRPEMPEVINRYIGEMQSQGYTFVPLSVMLAEDPQSLLVTP